MPGIGTAMNRRMPPELVGEDQRVAAEVGGQHPGQNDEGREAQQAVVAQPWATRTIIPIPAVTSATDEVHAQPAHAGVVLLVGDHAVADHDDGDGAGHHLAEQRRVALDRRAGECADRESRADREHAQHQDDDEQREEGAVVVERRDDDVADVAPAAQRGVADRERHHPGEGAGERPDAAVGAPDDDQPDDDRQGAGGDDERIGPGEEAGRRPRATRRPRPRPSTPRRARPPTARRRRAPGSC